MQNVPRHRHAKNDSNSCQTFYGTSMVGTSCMNQTPSVMFCSKRRPWFPKFRAKLGQCESLDEIEALLKVKVRQWRGPADLSASQGRIEDETIDEDTDIQAQAVDLAGLLVDDDSPDNYGTLELE